MESCLRPVFADRSSVSTVVSVRVSLAVYDSSVGRLSSLVLHGFLPLSGSVIFQRVGTIVSTVHVELPFRSVGRRVEVE